VQRREALKRMALVGGVVLTPPSAFSKRPAPGLEAIQRILTGRQLFIVPFSHGDWTWTYTREWTMQRDALIFSEVLDTLKKVPEYRFYIETWNEQLEPFMELHPERVPELARAIQKGKIEVCGAVCNQHPGWMESESQIRNLVIGRRLFSKLAPGLNLQVMTHNDVTPGCSQMPQILSKAGYRYYRMDRPDEALTAEGVPRDFVWVGLDGSEILASRGSACGFMNARAVPNDFAADWGKAVEAFYRQEIAPRLIPEAGSKVAVWMPFGCDDSRPMRSWLPEERVQSRRGGEPILPLPQFIQEWNRREPAPMRFATPLDVFRELDKEKSRLPRFRGILDPTMWTYWYGLNGNEGLRLWRTLADQSLVSAESWCACNASEGGSYPEKEFESLWHELLRAYSHAQMWLFSADYATQLERVKTTLSLSDSHRAGATQKIAGRIKTKEDRIPVVLFNDLPWERTEAVMVWAEFPDRHPGNVIALDAHGNTVPFQPIAANWYDVGGSRQNLKEAQLLVLARVPPMGYTTLYFEPALGRIAVPEPFVGDILDTEFATVGLSGAGVEFILDKARKTRYLHPGNIIFNEIRDTGEYHYGPVIRTLQWEQAKVTALVYGPLCSSFRLEGPLGEHYVRIKGHLYPHTEKIVFESEINSAGGDGHFMTTLGLPGRGKFFTDVHFGVERRDVSKIPYVGGEKLQKNVFYGEHWVDWSDGEKGVALLGTTGEKGYQVFPETNQLGHFLLMTLPPATNWERFVTSARRGLGLQHFSYTLLLHTGDWRQGNVVRRALEARHPILPVFPNHPELPEGRQAPQEKSFLELKSSTVQISAFYRSGDRYFVRLYESVGQKEEVTLKFISSISSAEEVDFNGERLSKPVLISNNTLRFAMKPWEITTIAFR
jgi:alpha-mannosidase